jgi:hypothetical protein
MKYLSAALVASVLIVGTSAMTYAAPVAPFDSAREATSGQQGSIEDVRWVRRCNWVREWRNGHRVRVQRCSRVWVGPPRRGRR